ncbi:MAG: HEAT repeat domain-containing protein [Spirochaetaceae bacterium]|jgi:HEAT repeat protein|nr:HEAT repeat domain-containing protein [Spirochaetaceae bacterium]
MRFIANWFALACFLLSSAFIMAQDSEEAQHEILLYGTDSEIAALIQTLKKNKADYLDDDLATLVRSTKNPQIKSAVIAFFSEREKSGLENEALYLIENRDDIESAHVIAAIEYLGRIRYEKAQQPLRALLDADEDSYRMQAVKAIGRTAGEASADDAAEYLINYYNTKTVSDDAQRELVLALGETHSKKASPFLVELVNENIRPGLTLSALGALEMIKDESALDTIASQLESKDPNIRAAAVGALGSFSGAAAEQTIIDAFRDSYYKTRLAAVKAAGEKLSAQAVPYLKFRAEKDEVQAVKEEAVRALGAIGAAGDGKAADALETIFDDKKTSDRNRILAAELLAAINGEKYAGKIIEKIDEAKRTNQKQVYNGLVAAISKAKSAKLSALAGQLFASKNASDIAFALEITGNNRFNAFLAETQRLAQDANSGLARKATEVLQKLQGAAPRLD